MELEKTRSAKRKPTKPASSDTPRKPSPEPDLQQQNRSKLVGEIEELLCRVCGVQSVRLAQQLVGQAGAMQVWSRLEADNELLQAAVDLLSELQPKNVTEALLAIQMIGVHHAACLFLKRATLEGQTFAGADAGVLRATRLMRLFNEQLEAMQKLKGKIGQQRVTVEHVHVNQGGQAIVGAITAPGRQGVDKP
jgi:hypothetical protein